MEAEGAQRATLPWMALELRVGVRPVASVEPPEVGARESGASELEDSAAFLRFLPGWTPSHWMPPVPTPASFQGDNFAGESVQTAGAVGSIARPAVTPAFSAGVAVFTMFAEQCAIRVFVRRSPANSRGVNIAA